MKRTLLFLVLCGICFMPLNTAFADEGEPQCDGGDQCKPWNEVLLAWTLTVVTERAIDASRALTTFVWNGERFVLLVSKELLKQKIWEDVRELLFKGLNQRIRPIFARILFGNAGLFYLALALSGVLLMIPMLEESRFVRPERAMLWGLLLMVLFVSSTLGIDFIQKIELFRVYIGQLAASGGGDGDNNPLLEAAMSPLKASEADLVWTEAGDYDLPKEFVFAYYQPIAYTKTPVQFFDGVFKFAAFINIADDNAILFSYGKAQEAIWIVILNLIPTILVLIFGLAVGMLSVGAMLTLIFLVCILPVGFFEFGISILNRVVKQYLFIVALTLFFGVLISVSGSLVEAAGGDGLAGMIRALPFYTITGLILWTMMSAAVNAMTGSFNIVTTTVQSINSLAQPEFMGNQAVDNAVEGVKGAALSTATLATAGLIGAATGGASLGLTAVGGAALGGLQRSGPAGAQAAQLMSTVGNAMQPAPKTPEEAQQQRHYDNVFAAARAATSPIGGAASLLEAGLRKPNMPGLPKEKTDSVEAKDILYSPQQAAERMFLSPDEFDRVRHASGVTARDNPVERDGKLMQEDVYGKAELEKMQSWLAATNAYSAAGAWEAQPALGNVWVEKKKTEASPTPPGEPTTSTKSVIPPFAGHEGGDQPDPVSYTETVTVGSAPRHARRSTVTPIESDPVTERTEELTPTPEAEPGLDLQPVVNSQTEAEQSREAEEAFEWNTALVFEDTPPSQHVTVDDLADAINAAQQRDGEPGPEPSDAQPDDRTEQMLEALRKQAETMQSQPVEVHLDASTGAAGDAQLQKAIRQANQAT